MVFHVTDNNGRNVTTDPSRTKHLKKYLLEMLPHTVFVST